MISIEENRGRRREVPSTPAIMELLGMNGQPKKQPASLLDSDPNSQEGLQARLATFKLSTYSDKPRDTDAFSAARHGWRNAGRETLRCVSCGAEFKADAVDLAARLSTQHNAGCVWKSRMCPGTLPPSRSKRAQSGPETLLKLPLSSPALLLAQTAARAVAYQAANCTPAIAACSLPPDFAAHLSDRIHQLLQKEHSRASSRAPSDGSEPPSPTSVSHFNEAQLVLSGSGWTPSTFNTNTLLKCELCLRSAFVSSAPFDPISAHRPFCPYLQPASTGQPAYEAAGKHWCRRRARLLRGRAILQSQNR
jgi:hypothetical protein